MDSARNEEVFSSVAARGRVLAASLIVILFTGHVMAQPALKKAIEKKPQAETTTLENATTDKPKPHDSQSRISADELGRDTPRGSVRGFLDNIRDGEAKKAAQYLDLSRLAPWQADVKGPALARQLKRIIDRALWIDLDLLSPDIQGYTDDGLPPSRERVGRIEIEERTIDILLQRRFREANTAIWLFAPVTVSQIPGLYTQFGYGPLGETLSSILPGFQFLGFQLWQWLGLIILIVLAYLVAMLITRMVTFFLRRRQTGLSDQVDRFIQGPLRLLLALVIVRNSIDLLGPSLKARELLNAGTVVIFIAAWALVRIFGILVDRFTARLQQSGQTTAVVLLRPASNAIKCLIFLIALMVWLDNIGIRVGTLLAGLGVGSLAVALAAQKSLENLIAAITLYISRPVKVGEVCRFGDHVGTIEEIGLRATQVRTRARSVVTVPNASFIDLHLENLSERDKILYNPRIRLRYDTTPDQLRYILVELRTLLYAHPMVLPEPARVRFVEYGAYSLDIDIFAYINVTALNAFFEVAEDLNLRTLDIIAKSGTRLALPTQTLHQEASAELDAQLRRSAEAQVQTWRDQNTLYLPKFPPEKIDELAASLTYPPPGSPDGAPPA